MKRAFSVTVSVFAILAAGGAAAQSAAGSQPAPAAAQPAPDAADPGSMGDIIVTAQKREQRLLDIPASITALSPKTLETQQVYQPTQLPRLVPGLAVASSYQDNNLNFTLRGIGPSNQYNFNNNAPVGLYVDEVYQSFTASPALQMFDLERVEVLKGPQGTLYGRNTTGGAVNFISRLPTADGAPNADFELTYGNYDRVRFRGAGDVTLVDDKLSLRTAFIVRAGDGYMKDPKGGQGYGSDRTVQGRAILRYRPSTDLDIRLKVFGNNSHGTAPAGISHGILPGGDNALGITRDGLANDEAVLDHTGYAKSDAYGGSLDVRGAVSDVQLVSLTSWQQSKFDVQLDCDASSGDLCSSDYRMTAEQFSQDVRGVYDKGSLLLIAGAFYGRDTLDYRGNVGFLGALSAASPGSFNPPVAGFFDPTLPPTGIFFRNEYDQIRRSTAVYAEAAYKLTSKLTLTLGARYTWDRTRIANVRTAILDAFDGAPRGTTIPFSLDYDPQAALAAQTINTSALTGRAVLTYKPVETLTLYASYSRGYRTGAFNGQQFFLPEELNYVGPEKVDNYEAGIKGQLFDRAVTFALAGFVTNIRNQQVLSQQVSDVASYPALAGVDGRVHGAEADLQWAVTPRFRLNAAGTLLDARFAEGQAISGFDISGNRFPFAPRLSIQGGADWTMFITPDGQSLALNLSTSYTSRFYYDPQNGQNSVGARLKSGQEPYALVDGRLTWAKGGYSVSVWALNLLDRYYEPFNSSAEGFGFDYATRGQPRTFGGSVGVKF